MYSISRLSLFVFAVGFVISLSSCSKQSGVADPTTTVTSGQLIVAFSSAGIPISNTDSMVTLLINGTDTIRRKAIRGGTFYSVSLDGLSSTTYKAVSKIYTAADNAGLRHLYRYEVNVNTAAVSNLIAPTSNQFDLWKDNLLFRNDQYNITFVMAVSPADPYFELILPQSLPYKNVYIERNAYITIGGVKYAVKYGNTIFKAADYKGFHSNVTAFATFSTQVATVKYDSADFSLQIYNDINNDYKILVKQALTVSQ